MTRKIQEDKEVGRGEKGRMLDGEGNIYATGETRRSGNI